MKLIQCLMLNGLLIFSATVFAKPQVPVTVSISSPDVVLIGEPVRFSVSASSRVASEHLQITVQPPAGMKLISGHLQWTGPVRANQPVVMTFTAVLPENSHYIAAQVAINGLANSRFMNRAVLQFREVRALQRQKYTPKIRYSHGRRVVEYPLNPAN